MAAIALPAFHITTIKRHTIECSHVLQQDLEAYKAFYKRCYGADVSEPDLIREMIRIFMEGDPEFRRFKGEGAKARIRSRSRESEGVRRANGNPTAAALVGSSTNER